MGFDFDRMTKSFETIQQEYATALAKRMPDVPPLPSTEAFLTAMGEVLKLFETLGSAFTFVKRDIEKKLAVIERHKSNDPAHYSDLNKAVEFEMATDALTRRNDEGLQSCSRTVLRLMWALKFADVLLEGLAQAFDEKSGLTTYERSLKWAVARAYEEALAERHSWTIRRSVKGACMLLPSKETFMVRVGVETDKRDEFLKRLGVSMSPLVRRMYDFYGRHDLLNLP